MKEATPWKQDIKCIFCNAKFPALELLKVHSASCREHPAVKDADRLRRDLFITTSTLQKEIEERISEREKLIEEFEQIIRRQPFLTSHGIADLVGELETLQPNKSERRHELVVRCNSCNGTQIWKRNDAGEILVYHDCWNGKHTKARIDKILMERTEECCAPLNRDPKSEEQKIICETPFTASAFDAVMAHRLSRHKKLNALEAARAVCVKYQIGSRGPDGYDQFLNEIIATIRNAEDRNE